MKQWMQYAVCSLMIILLIGVCDLNLMKVSAKAFEKNESITYDAKSAASKEMANDTEQAAAKEIANDTEQAAVKEMANDTEKAAVKEITNDKEKSAAKEITNDAEKKQAEGLLLAVVESPIEYTDLPNGADEIFRNAAAISVGANVELTVGEELYYGNYSTNYFDVNGKPAYCLEPLKDTPTSGSYEAQALNDGDVRKGLYYAYGGPGYEIYRAKFGAIGVSTSYSVNDEYCMSHCILSYFYMGSDDAFFGLDQSTIQTLKQKAENIKSLPDPPESFFAFLFNLDADGQVMGGSGKDRVGTVEIYKETDQPEWTKENKCYSLAGAVFGIYEPGKKEPTWELTTDESGYAKQEEIPIGNYEIKEVKSPVGHALKFQSESIRVNENVVCTYRCTDEAQYYPADLILQKEDQETKNSKAQGAATLENAEFTIKYYAGHYDKNPEETGLLPVRTWVMKTDSEGKIRMNEAQKVGGDPFYKNASGEVVFPLGTITFQETKAPVGYLLNNHIFVETIKSDGTGVTDTIFQAPVVLEQVVRGDLQIVKFREDEEKEEEQDEQKVPLEGIIFKITSKTTGWTCEIITDENGYATTRKKENGKGGLIYDTYIVSEENAPNGLKPAEDFEITIDEDMKTLYYILENKQIFSPVKLVKKDSETGKIIPIADAVFRLLDRDKKPITMTTYYPQENRSELFRTDESGSFILPEKLPFGNYYFEEVEAPKGYIIKDGLVPFTITENHDWDKPFVVECENNPAKGQIYIQKNDAVTEKGIAGVQFKIKAAEDILTPEGTVRAEKGDVVSEMTTDQNGFAQSEQLYLGTYEIEEIKQAEGYILPKKNVTVKLEYEGQTVEVVTKQTEILNQPVSIRIRKIDRETEIPLAGVKFELWEKEAKLSGTGTEDDLQKEEKRTDLEFETYNEKEENSLEEKTVYETDENGEIQFSYLRPGTYCFRETEPAAGYANNATVWEFSVDEDGTVDGENEKLFVIENDHTRIKDTHAYWKESEAKEIVAGEENIICDTVKFKHMEAAASYTMKGILMDADTGEQLMQDGNPVITERTFTGMEAEDGITMEFEVDSAKFPGKRIVVFEVLYLGDTLIDAHRDLGNQEQTVSILKKKETIINKENKPDAVNTGDDMTKVKQNILLSALTSIAAAGCIAVIVKRKKRD